MEPSIYTLKFIDIFSLELILFACNNFEPIKLIKPATFYRSVCTKPGKWAVIQLCVRGVDFASFYDFSNGFWKTNGLKWIRIYKWWGVHRTLGWNNNSCTATSNTVLWNNLPVLHWLKVKLRSQMLKEYLRLVLPPASCLFCHGSQLDHKVLRVIYRMVLSY
jgi:hypothetical protein